MNSGKGIRKKESIVLFHFIGKILFEYCSFLGHDDDDDDILFEPVP